MAAVSKKVTKPASKLALAPAVKGAIIKATPTQVIDRVKQSLVQLASLVTNVPNEAIAPTLTDVKKFTDVLEAAEKTLKARAVEYVRTEGKQVTDKGTKRVEVDGWKLDIQPNRTGYDAKKVEALLRNKGFEPEAGMDSRITYSVNEGKLADLLKMDDGITTDELEATRYDLTFKVVAKPVADGDES